MKTVLITGADGFVGRNLSVTLSRNPDLRVLGFDRNDAPDVLARAAAEADVVFHLAGVNRPLDPSEFELGNAETTARLVELLSRRERQPLIVFSSSIQAALENDYGRSKLHAEGILKDYSDRTGAPVRIFRLPNVFGKWSRPNYNSVVATFCHNIAHDLEITISDPARELELVYIDDVVSAFVGQLSSAERPGWSYEEVQRTYRITLGALAERIRALHAIRKRLMGPDLSDPLTRCLHATYLSYLSGEEAKYALEQRCDARGALAELLKSPAFGQIFVSRTKPGIVRGNHYHDSKIEKFCVVEGQAVIRLRHMVTGEVVEHRVDGRDFVVIDITPGWTHSIENVGTNELVTLFWANEVFNPERPDTYMAKA
jgi:UDP-2-acetamido-2,6-beta-L-arabino-hexul-4-ose reductase